MKAKNYSMGKGIKPVSRLPDWLIKVIGRFDSRKAPDVAIAHLNKYLAKLAKNEKDEALLAEAALKPSRAAGSRHLHVVIHNDPGAERKGTKQNFYNALTLKNAPCGNQRCIFTHK